MYKTDQQISKEFDKEFPPPEICLQVCHPEDKERLLNFIHQLRRQQDREAVIEWVLEKREEYRTKEDHIGFYIGYVGALDDLISYLKGIK